jgi:hypothetical protein
LMTCSEMREGVGQQTDRQTDDHLDDLLVYEAICGCGHENDLHLVADIIKILEPL